MAVKRVDSMASYTYGITSNNWSTLDQLMTLPANTDCDLQSQHQASQRWLVNQTNEMEP